MSCPAAIALAVLSAIIAPAWSQGLLHNPGFEAAVETTNLPAEWTARSVTPKAHSLTPQAHSGQQAARIAFSQGEGNQVSGYYYSDAQPLPVCEEMTVSAWVKVKTEGGGKGAFLRLLFSKQESYIALHDGRALSDSGGEWKRLKLSATPPPEAESWRMSVEFQGVGEAVFDDCDATIAPAEVFPAASVDAPSGQVLDLGDGRVGVLGDAAQPHPGDRISALIRGASAMPPVLRVGAVWYRKGEQLGVLGRRARAWQQDTEVFFALRPAAGATQFRPIVWAQSRELWDAAEVLRLESQGTPPAAEPAFISPTKHPRLFLSGKELQRLRETLQADPPAELAAQYAQLLGKADQCFTEDKLTVYGGRYATAMPPAVPPRHKDNFPYWTGLSREIEVRIEALATAYLLSGQQKYADLCLEWTLALCQWPQWTDPDYSSRDACLDTGHFCHAVAFAYDFLYDVLSEEDRQTIRDALLDKGAAAVMRAGESGWARSMSWPNGFAVVMGGMGIAGIATLGDDGRAEQYVTYARRRIGEFYDARDQDGGYVEGLVYGGYAMSLTMPFAGTLSKHGDDTLVSHPYIRKNLRFATWCLDPVSMGSVNFCDSNYSHHDYNALAGWLAHTGDGLGRWYLEHNAGIADLWRYTPPLAILWHPRGVKAQAPTDWPAAAHFRDIGWAVLRSDFTGDGFLLAMRSGYHGSHCQLDQNSFMLNVKGRWVLSDPGYGRTPTALHSTLLVDGKGQAAAGGAIEAFGQTGKVSYCAGDAARCYEGLSRFTRHVVAVNSEYILIIDELAPTQQSVAIKSLLTLGEGEHVLKNGRELSAPGPQTCNMLLGFDAESGITQQGVKQLAAEYSLKEPGMFPMLLTPGSEEPIGELTCEGDGDCVLLRVDLPNAIDYLVLNVSGESQTVGELSSDARLAWVRVKAGAVVQASAVWGSQISFAGKTILDEPEKRDFAMP